MDASEMDALDATPEMAIQCALDEIRTTHKDDPPSKALVILLWSENDSYVTQFYNSGLKCSEAVALLEIEKMKFIDMVRGKDKSE